MCFLKSENSTITSKHSPIELRKRGQYTSNWDTYNHGRVCFNNAVMRPNDADEMTNSLDPDQEPSSLSLLCLHRPTCHISRRVP